MARRSVSALLLLCLLLSCQKEQFTVSSLSLSSDSEILVNADGSYAVNEKVMLKGSIEGRGEDSYSFRLTSPDGDLAWEDSFEGFAELELTPGALFPEGGYKLVLYSTNGTEYSGTVIYHGIPEVAWYGPDGLTRESYAEESDADGVLLDSGMKSKGSQPGEAAAVSRTRAEDGWGSTVSLTQELI